ncbi:ABC transporter permease [Niabella sp. 22666]|uniref:ABC transporter permease n=1 Tax=Niabella sp. 22666 TaxID=3453954 RepID=UPI003F834AF4
MFNNYIKTIFRNLWKNKGYSFLNIFGLAIGITCAGFIFLWVEHEVSYDQYHAKKDKLYEVMTNQTYGAQTSTFSSTPLPLGPALQAEIPGIANTCRIADKGTKQLLTVGDKSLFALGAYADASIFSMFSFQFTEGNAKTAFSEPHSLVITQGTAEKFFGSSKNIVGKTIRVDNNTEYAVSGVIKNLPTTSTIGFDWVAPFAVWYNLNQSLAQAWGNNCLQTFVELKEGITAASVNKSISNMIKKKEPEATVVPILWAMNDWHLKSEFKNGVQTGGGKIEYVRMFSIIAWIILIIACINFMNLSTAQSEKRAREVGVRKVLGAGKRKLVVQFIAETLFMAFLSAFIAVLLMALLLPTFNLLVQTNLSLGITNPAHMVSIVAIALICGLIAGSYPSFYLSSFNPVSVLKGIRAKTGSATFIRKGLVILQFSISIILIVSTVIIFRQIQHVKSRNLGFNKNNLVQIDMNDEIRKNYAAIDQNLLNTNVIEHIGLADYNNLYGGNNTGGLAWSGKPDNDKTLISTRGINPGFFDAYGMQLVSGKNFVTTDSAQTDNPNIIITRSLEKKMGNGSALGKKIYWDGNSEGGQFTVVGVVNDYIYGDMYAQPDPVIFYCTNMSSLNNMYLRLKPGVDIEQAISKITAAIKPHTPSYPVASRFVDEQFNQMFRNEQLISTLSRIFAALAILISCLGLFGLSAYTAEKRKKEIGIRKVLGANITGITRLLSKEFLLLVAISCLIAYPIAWLLMNRWLQNYSYRTEVNLWVFLIAGGMAMLLTIITVSFQAIKAAIANPVKSLRNE